MQVEEAYIGAEEFCKRLGQSDEAVLNTEPLVLQGLNFDLITYTPYTSLSGFFAVSTTRNSSSLSASWCSMHSGHVLIWFSEQQSQVL